MQYKASKVCVLLFDLIRLCSQLIGTYVNNDVDFAHLCTYITVWQEGICLSTIIAIRGGVEEEKGESSDDADEEKRGTGAEETTESSWNSCKSWTSSQERDGMLCWIVTWVNLS